MIQYLLSSSPRSIAGIVAVAVAIWLSTGCAVTDAFGIRSDDDSTPVATATPAATATTPPAAAKQHDRAYDLRHRYLVSPPDVGFDPGLPAPSPEDRLLDLAGERWSETESVHFRLNVDGTTYLDVNETIELKSVDGDLLRPDRTQAEASVQIGFASFDVDLVVIGDDAYMTNFLTGNWERAPANFAFNPALIFDDKRGVTSVLDSMSDVEIGDERTVGGVDIAEITGTVERDDIADLVAGSLEGDDIAVKFWVDVASGDILELSLAEPDDVDGEPTTWTIRFSNHDEPVTIEAPDI